MPSNNNPPARGDHLAAMLSRGEAPTLDALLALCPNEPLADVDEIDRQMMTVKEHAKWSARATELHAQYPGYQEAYWYREHMKYGHCFGRGPLPDRPLPNSARQGRHHFGKASWFGIQRLRQSGQRKRPRDHDA